MNRIFSVIAFVIAFVATGFGQGKFEREYRIKPEEVPEPALSFVMSAPIDGKIKWYFEENLRQNSVEAKFTHLKKQYSVEFDTLGQLQDIEMQAELNELPKKIETSITTYLSSAYDKYLVQKMQIQYRGEISSFAGYLDGKTHFNKYTLNYELVVKGRIDRNWNLYEVVFDENGSWINTSKIMLRDTDHLEY